MTILHFPRCGERENAVKVKVGHISLVNMKRCVVSLLCYVKRSKGKWLWHFGLSHHNLLHQLGNVIAFVIQEGKWI